MPSITGNTPDDDISTNNHCNDDAPISRIEFFPATIFMADPGDNLSLQKFQKGSSRLWEEPFN